MAKSKVFKNCLALLLITLVAGLALAVVNEITAKPISEAENKAKMAAYESVFSGVEFEEIPLPFRMRALTMSCVLWIKTEIPWDMLCRQPRQADTAAMSKSQSVFLPQMIK